MRALVLALCALCLGGVARAEDAISVGKTTAQGLTWIPVDAGIAQGIFARLGVRPEVSAAQGGAKLHQAMVAGAIEIGLGSGTDFSFLVKGAPELAVADMIDRLNDLGVTARPDITDLAMLKGARIGVSAPASMTFWSVLALNKARGWSGVDAAVPVAVGGNWAAFTAALETRQVSAVIADPALGYKLAESGKGHLVAPVGSYVPAFTAHVIFATKAALEGKPEAVRRFLQGWFESVAWMQQHRAESLKIAAGITGMEGETLGRVYDEIIPDMRRDGHFNAEGLKAVAGSLQELGLVEALPDLSPYITEAYLPR